jgi:CheY-like chemotaxis protein
MRVLIVEDDLSVRTVLREVMDLGGHAVAEAGTLLEATQLLDTHGCQVLVSDGSFPKDATGSGVGPYGPVLCQMARSAGVPAILVSGDDALVEDEERRGHVAFRKPYGLFPLLQAVERVARPADRATA